MKKLTSKILGAFLALATGLSLTACVKEEDVNKAVSPVAQQVTTINETLTELQALDAELDGAIEALESKAAALETSLTTVNGGLESLDGEIDSVETALNAAKLDLGGKIEEAQADIAALKEKDAELDGAIEALETSLKKEVSDAKAWAAETYLTIEASEALEQEIKDLIKSLETRVGALETSVGTLETTVSALQTQAQQNSDAIAAIQGQLACLNSGGHSIAYTSLEDGTHYADCKNCDYAAEETCKYTYTYVADNTHIGACDNCLDEVTQNCVMDDTTGECENCKEFIAVAKYESSLGEGYYNNLKVHDYVPHEECNVTLLKDIADDYIDLNNCSVDLNGFDLYFSRTGYSVYPQSGVCAVVNNGTERSNISGIIGDIGVKMIVGAGVDVGVIKLYESMTLDLTNADFESVQLEIVAGADCTAEQVVGNYAVYDENGEQVTGELSVSETYTIQRIRKEVAQENVTLGEYDNVYDGEEKKPTVTVVVDGKTLVEGKDYDVEYANNVYVSTEENGKATATVTFKGTYKGQVVVEFEIIQDPSTGGFDGEWVTF